MQRRFLAQQSVATLLRHCFEWVQHCSNIATLCCAKNRRCESPRVTSSNITLTMRVLPSRDGEKITPVLQVRSPVDSARLCFVCSRRPVPVRRAVGAAPEPLSVDDSCDSGSSSDDDSSAILFTQKSSSSSTCCVSFQVRYSSC